MGIDVEEKKFIRGKHTCFWCYNGCILIFIVPLVIMILSTSHYLYTYIIISIGLSIFIGISVLIFYFESKTYISDLSKIKTEYKPEGVVITDALKTQSFQILLLLILFIIIMILFIASVSMGLDPIPAIFAVLIIVAVLIVGLVFILKKLVGISKVRKFSISEKGIEITIPPRPVFYVNWIDFDKIMIEYKRKEISGRSFGGPPLVISYYKLSFIRRDFIQKFKIEAGKDFHIEITREIFNHLKDYSLKMNKEFIGPEGI